MQTHLPNLRRLAYVLNRVLVAARGSRFGTIARNGQPYAMELAYLLTQVSVMATFTAWLYSSNPLFRNVYRNSMVCLSISLIVFHLLAYRNRKRSTKHITRLIDYVYLGIGALGLLSASDFTVRTYRDQVLHAVKQSLADLKILPVLQMDTYKSTCSDDRLEKACTAYADMFSIARQTQALDPSEKSSYLVKGALTRITRIAGKETRVRVSLERFIQNPYEDLERFKFLEDEPFGYYPFGAPDGPNLLREFGFYLIASALALRLTRVSIELFRW